MLNIACWLAFADKLSSTYSWNCCPLRRQRYVGAIAPNRRQHGRCYRAIVVGTDEDAEEEAVVDACDGLINAKAPTAIMRIATIPIARYSIGSLLVFGAGADGAGPMEDGATGLWINWQSRLINRRG